MDKKQGCQSQKPAMTNSLTTINDRSQQFSGLIFSCTYLLIKISRKRASLRLHCVG